MTFIYNPSEHEKPRTGPPTVDTLVGDIYAYMKGNQQGTIGFSDSDAKVLGRIIAETIIVRLKERQAPPAGDPTHQLRVSNYGLHPRRHWFDQDAANRGLRKEDNFTGPDLLKFLIGDVWEAVLLYLSHKTGHHVTHRQEEVIVDGIPGHLDSVIDGVVVDIKSASRYAFDHKFKNGALISDPNADGFGYIPQVRGYGKAVGIAKQAFLAANKETGELCLLKVPESISFDVSAHIEKVREALKKPEPPKEYCFEPVQEDNGNKSLHKNCSFCPHKFRCWKDANGGAGLRAFKYAKSMVYLTHVEKAPKVPEVNLYGNEEWEEDDTIETPP